VPAKRLGVAVSQKLPVAVLLPDSIEDKGDECCMGDGIIRHSSVGLGSCWILGLDGSRKLGRAGLNA
jgi:hypothetical protein